jgi:hypothetical protein
MMTDPPRRVIEPSISLESLTSLDNYYDCKLRQNPFYWEYNGSIPHGYLWNAPSDLSEYQWTQQEIQDWYRGYTPNKNLKMKYPAWLTGARSRIYIIDAKEPFRKSIILKDEFGQYPVNRYSGTPSCWPDWANEVILGPHLQSDNKDDWPKWARLDLTTARYIHEQLDSTL